MLFFISSLMCLILMLSTPAGVRICTFFLNIFSKKEVSSMKFSSDGSSNSTTRSISLLSFCSPLAKDPKSPKCLTLYFDKASLCFLRVSRTSALVKDLLVFFISCLYSKDNYEKILQQSFRVFIPNLYRSRPIIN